jgi:hypothetical protein
MWPFIPRPQPPRPDPDTAARAAAVLAALPADEVATARMRERHLRARVFVAGAPQVPGDGWSVDLDVPRFTVVAGGKVISEGETRLIGTWSRTDGTFLGAWDNTSVSGPGAAEVRGWFADGPLAPLLTMGRFEVDEETVGTTAAWLAWKHGSVGFRGDVDVSGPVVAFLAVRLTRHHGHEDGRDAWCTMCGEHARRRPRLFAGAHGFVCDACVTLAAEVFAERLDGASTDEASAPDPVPTLPPCCLCGGRGRRIYGPESAVCVACTGMAAAGLGVRTGR